MNETCESFEMLDREGQCQIQTVLCLRKQHETKW